MSNPNPERDERDERVLLHPTEQVNSSFDAWWDEYQRPWLPNGVSGYEHAKKAWTAAIGLCIENVQTMHDEFQAAGNVSAGEAVFSYSAMRAAARSIITTLQSLREQEK